MQCNDKTLWGLTRQDNAIRLCLWVSEWAIKFVNNNIGIPAILISRWQFEKIISAALTLLI